MVWMLGAVTLLYTGTALWYFWNGLPQWGVFWLCYAVANTIYLYSGPKGVA